MQNFDNFIDINKIDIYQYNSCTNIPSVSLNAIEDYIPISIIYNKYIVDIFIKSNLTKIQKNILFFIIFRYCTRVNKQELPNQHNNNNDKQDIKIESELWLKNNNYLHFYNRLNLAVCVYCLKYDNIPLSDVASNHLINFKSKSCIKYDKLKNPVFIHGPKRSNNNNKIHMCIYCLGLNGMKNNNTGYNISFNSLKHSLHSKL